MVNEAMLARALAAPAAAAGRSWWTARKQRRFVMVDDPRARPHRGCKDGPHATLASTTVTNWSDGPAFDVEVLVSGRTGEGVGEIAGVVKLSPLGPFSGTWTIGWDDRWAAEQWPVLLPEPDGTYAVTVTLLWADRPDGPRWQLVKGTSGAGRLSRAPGQQWWRRAARAALFWRRAA